MTINSTIIASGSLATSRRTIGGVLGQLQFLEISYADSIRIMTDAGLPPRALNEPDFPISMDQDLRISQAMVRLLDMTVSPTTFLFGMRELIGIEHFGVLGMAIRHAANVSTALNISLRYPQLMWGHSRMTVRKDKESYSLAFSMDTPSLRGSSSADLNRIVEYCIVLDLVSMLRINEDITDGLFKPTRIKLPTAEPSDWKTIAGELPWPIDFSETHASIIYPVEFENTPLPRANPLIYRSYEVIAEKLSHHLADKSKLSESVTQWLWTQSPPLKRGEIAKNLAMSERSLTRQLHSEGTSYSKLLAGVQNERALNFLNNRSLPVAEIAYRLGYSEPAAFSRAFYKWQGLSPLQWRQSSASRSSR